MPSAHLIDGRALADDWLTDISVQVRALGVPVGLAAVAVAGDEGLAQFVRLKQKAAQAVGIDVSSYFVESEADMADTLRFLASDDSVQGIFVELPLPSSWNQERVLSLIPRGKDVDALLPRPGAVLPPAVVALRAVLDSRGVTVPELRVAVVGQGMLIGAPLTHWLRAQGAVVDAIDVGTSEPAAIAARADVVICGVGKPGLITADWIKQGATVIDFGYSRTADGRVSGDADAASVKKKAGAFTPVPGGMGPLVVAAVLENLVALATR